MFVILLKILTRKIEIGNSNGIFNILPDPSTFSGQNSWKIPTKFIQELLQYYLGMYFTKTFQFRKC